MRKFKEKEGGKESKSQSMKSIVTAFCPIPLLIKNNDGEVISLKHKGNKP